MVVVVVVVVVVVAAVVDGGGKAGSNTSKPNIHTINHKYMWYMNVCTYIHHSCFLTFIKKRSTVP